MIARYTDHAANERTFLAWVRTALAVMAYGGITARSEPGALTGPDRRGFTGDAALACVAIGVVLLISSHRRYRRTRAAIGVEAVSAPEGSAMEGVLTGSMAFFGMAVLAILARSSAL